jgi:hypothetical protein
MEPKVIPTSMAKQEEIITNNPITNPAKQEEKAQHAVLTATGDKKTGNVAGNKKPRQEKVKHKAGVSAPAEKKKHSKNL